MLDRTAEGGRSHMKLASLGICPNSRQAGDALCRDGEIGTGAHYDVFEAADEFDYAQSFAFAVRRWKSAEIEDRIADDLAGTVEGDVATAVTFEEFDAAAVELLGRGKNVGDLGIAAEGDDRGVFEQEEDVADLSLFTEVYEFLLQAQGG